MSRRESANPFNSPLETGVRSLAILVASYPDALDIERLVEMDYLVVHSEDAGGPKSLHAPLPLRAGELLVRRGLIETGLTLMMSRGLVQRITKDDGFSYLAGESAGPFVGSLTQDYSMRLIECARWATEQFRDTPTQDIRAMTHRFFESWSSQFQPVEPGGGSLK